MEEYNRYKELNNIHFDEIKKYEDNPLEWNKKWQEGYFQYPYDNFQGVNAEMEVAIERQFLLIKMLSKIQFAEKKHEKLSEYMFITINPDPSLKLSVKDMNDKLSKVCKSTRIIEYLYSIEQRGDTIDTMGNGIHSHILVKHIFPKFCKLRQHFYNNFKNVIGNIKHIDIKYCKSVIDVSNRINYINGEKIDKEKMDKVNIDKKWREQWNIDDTYGNLLGPQVVDA